MKRPIPETTVKLLNEALARYGQADFIANDPVLIPHLFTKRQDVEIAGLFAAVLAWGQRTTIIRNARNLMERMDMQPYEFIQYHQAGDLKRLEGFVHRTFNDTDLLYFVHFLKFVYSRFESLEDAFSEGMKKKDDTIEIGLVHFQRLFVSLPDLPHRTVKHIATPAKNSACKRLCMYLRWMVRSDAAGVDFGIWKKIKPAQLICPMDVHVHRVAQGLRLVSHPKADWRAALELTETLRRLSPEDPVKYDYALFGLGVEERF